MPAKRYWLERCKRLAGMGTDEFCLRIRQEFAKRWDVITGQSTFCQVARVSGDRLQEHGRFFFNGGDVPQILECLRERLPGGAEEIIQKADRICRHSFDLLGYEAIHYGREIDWHVDAVHSKRAPRCPWFKVPYLDFEQVGDHKIIWELSRHQHLVTLAKAYRLSGEERYAEELFGQWYHWQRENPYGIGINWASSLEVAFRTLSWFWIRYLLDGCSIVPGEFLNDLGRAVILNGRHIEQFLSTYFSPNTHLLGEGVALFFIGILCPGLPAAQRWRARGWQIVLNQAHRQVLPDGMHFEQSIYYHIYALDFFIHSRVLAALSRIPVPAAFDQTIERMMEAVCALSAAGPLPRFGDDDGGRVFDPCRNRVEHLTDPLASGAILFNRGDFKAAARAISEETLWLFGVEGVKRFDALPIVPSAGTSFTLESSGLHVMATSHPPAQRLVIDAGPQGVRRAGHGHADALSVQVAVNGHELLIDSGTRAYVDSTDERDRFRKTAAHNTVAVDDSSQAEPCGPFGWETLPNTTVEHWNQGCKFDFFAGSHDGYSRHGVVHRRYVVYAKPHFWFVRDVLEGEGMHQLDVRWHFAPGALAPRPGGFTFLRDRQAAVNLFLTSSRGCSQEILDDWCSPVYGRKERCPGLRIGVRATLPVEFVALLAPPSQRERCTDRLQTLETPRDYPGRAYQYTAAEVTSYLFFAERASAWCAGDFASDAHFLFCSKTPGDNQIDFAMSGGSYLTLCGQRLLGLPESIRWKEWRSEHAGSLRCDDAAARREARYPVEDPANALGVLVTKP